MYINHTLTSKPLQVLRTPPYLLFASCYNVPVQGTMY